jgi:hypothetical protein
MLNAQGTTSRKIPVKGHALGETKAKGLTPEGASRWSLWLVSKYKLTLANTFLCHGTRVEVEISFAPGIRDYPFSVLCNTLSVVVVKPILVTIYSWKKGLFMLKYSKILNLPPHHA